jgi:hypothetical protein
MTQGVLDELLAAAMAVTNDAVENKSEDLPELEIFAAQLSGPMPRQQNEPGGADRLGGYLTECLATAMNPLDRRLTEALLEAASYLWWFSPYEEVAGGPQLEALKNRYACTMLAGPEGLSRYKAPCACSETFIAFTLQYPQTHYPAHSHFDREIYHVIAGRSKWQRGEIWSTRDSGDWIFHSSHQYHAMTTSHEPLLSMVTWIDGIKDSEVAVHE